MVSFRSAARCVNRQIHALVPQSLICQLVQQVGHPFRKRKLGPHETLLLWINQLLAVISLSTLCIRAGGRFTAPALCRAYRRLPLELLQQLHAWIVQQHLPDGPRVLLIDAKNHYVCDTPALRRRWRLPRQKKASRSRCDYPQLRTLCVMDSQTGLLLGQVAFPSDQHEACWLGKVLHYARRGDTLVMDRGLVSYANLCQIKAKGLHVVGRLSRTLQANAQGARRLAGRRGQRRHDWRVTWKRPSRRSKGYSLIRWKALPRSLDLREVKVKAPRGRCRGRICLITDRMDLPLAVLADWYRDRWSQEVNFRHMKCTLGMEFLASRTCEGVDRELVMQMVAYNLVRVMMMRCAGRAGVEPGRVSFLGATEQLLSGNCRSIRAVRIYASRHRTGRPRRRKYRGKNYRCLLNRPFPQRRVA